MDNVEFGIALRVFVEGCQNIHTDHQAHHPAKGAPNKISCSIGKRYAKVIRQCAHGEGAAVHCFVNLDNGDVLNAASWEAPAKHVWGNIFDEHHGLKNMNEYGPAYLR